MARPSWAEDYIEIAYKLAPTAAMELETIVGMGQRGVIAYVKDGTKYAAGSDSLSSTIGNGAELNGKIVRVVVSAADVQEAHNSVKVTVTANGGSPSSPLQRHLDFKSDKPILDFVIDFSVTTA